MSRDEQRQKRLKCAVCWRRARARVQIDGSHLPICDACWDAAYTTAGGSEPLKPGQIPEGIGYRTTNVLREMLNLSRAKSGAKL